MQKSESVLENATHNTPWDFETQTDHTIVANKKRTCQIVDFTVPTDLRMKIEKSEKINKYLKLARGHKGDGDTNCSWCTWNSPPKA